jgi:hypothetical protein
MPLTPRPGAARSAAELNRATRALWVDGVLVDPERYQRLLVEWAAAVRAEQAGVAEAA